MREAQAASVIAVAARRRAVVDGVPRSLLRFGRQLKQSTVPCNAAMKATEACEWMAVHPTPRR